MINFFSKIVFFFVQQQEAVLNKFYMSILFAMRAHWVQNFFIIFPTFQNVISHFVKKRWISKKTFFLQKHPILNPLHSPHRTSYTAASAAPRSAARSRSGRRARSTSDPPAAHHRSCSGNTAGATGSGPGTLAPSQPSRPGPDPPRSRNSRWGPGRP